MISLALPSSKLRSTPELGEPTSPVSGEKGANTFSAVLASLGDQQADGEGEIAATMLPATETADFSPETALHPALPGITLPVPAETGKTLPDIAADNPVGDSSLDTDGANGATEVVDAPVAVLQLPVAVTAQEVSAAAEAKPAHAFAGQSSPTTGEGTSLPSAALPTLAKRQGGEQAEAPSVALHVAPEADPKRSDRRDARTSPTFQPVKSRESIVEGLTPKVASADPAPQAPAASLATGPQTETSQPGRLFESAKPAFQTDALQDLARAVDRLAAAREALAPATAALAVKHAQFGDLSLRFDQQRDGHLAVQLSAGDPDSHRAVAAAVSERSAAAPTDSHASTGQSQTQAQARGAAAERDGDGGNTARQDQPQQRRSAPQNRQPGNDTRQAGIFA